VFILGLLEDHPEDCKVCTPCVFEHGADGVRILYLDVCCVARAACKLDLAAHDNVLRFLSQQLFLPLLTVSIGRLLLDPRVIIFIESERTSLNSLINFLNKSRL